MSDDSTKSLSVSRDRFTFQLENQRQRLDDTADPQLIQARQHLVEFYQRLHDQHIREAENAPEVKDDLEYDLRSTPWILSKVRNSEAYAQNLYAAMCNNEFQRHSVMPILRGETWSCSWRSAGGIIADMRQQGDYIDWYCSGMGIRENPADDPDNDLTKNYVNESMVTPEIQEDLMKLGWRVVDIDPHT